jgi:hypothetical protein
LQAISNKICVNYSLSPPMTLSPELLALARYLAGEFSNQAQALAEPVWYVHLRLWQRPVPAPLFPEDSIALFAEQANALNLDQPYRQRILRLQPIPDQPSGLQVEYYALKEPAAWRGAGRNRALLGQLTPAQIEFLPGCTLSVTAQPLTPDSSHFSAFLPPCARCSFTYQGEIRQVSLGFEATPAQFLSYDKGIDPATGNGLWGAVKGPFQFTKCQDFSAELPV